MRGVTIVEAVVAIAVFALIASVAYRTYTAANFLAERADQKSEALWLAEEGIEATRAIRNQNFSTLTAGNKGIALSGNAWTFSGTSDMANGFLRTIAIGVIDADTRSATSTVSWSDRGATSTVSLSTILTNWRKVDLASNHLTINTSNACVYTLDSRYLGGITLVADSTGGALSVTRIQASWVSTTRTLNQVVTTGATYWTGTASSGTTITLTTPITISAGGSVPVYFRWDGSVSGKTFTLNFFFADGSSKSVTITSPILSLCIVL